MHPYISKDQGAFDGKLDFSSLPLCSGIELGMLEWVERTGLNWLD
jgi:hypothetical protein